MTQFRKALRTKIISLPCELETWANIGNIGYELGLFIIDITS